MSRRKQCKIAVIGTVNRDTVIRADKSRIEGYGGILYNLNVLSRFSGSHARIFPVANIGKDHDQEIRLRIGALPNVDSSTLTTVTAANNHCHLTYKSVSEKEEVLSGWVGGVKRAKLQLILDADYILVNFISGSDISTANLKWLRKRTSARIYIDFHSRTLGRSPDGGRFLRRPRDWGETVWCADILQMNEVEYGILAGETPDLDECRRFMVKYLSANAQGLVVTLGMKGCIVCYRKRTEIKSKLITAPPISKALDTTGCGDVFAAAFLAARSRGRNFPESAVFAVNVASERAGVDGIEQIRYDRFWGQLAGKSGSK